MAVAVDAGPRQLNNLTRFTLSNPIYGWALALLCLLGGLHGIQKIGRLEDPAYPIKLAYVITTYPGASAQEVEQEVTDRVEDALQELPYVERMVSKSVPGRSEVRVELEDSYDTDETPQIYDELRRRVSEAEASLPPGTGRPLVEDDFSDVYGILYAISTPGYTDAEIHDMARHIASGLKQVPHVAKVETRGVPQEAVYVELDETRLSRTGFSVDALADRIRQENQVVAAGSALFDGRRLRIAQPAAISSVSALEDMKLGIAGSTEILRLADIATITRTRVEVPPELVRVDGEPVFAVAVSVTPGQNVVAVGKAVDARMQQIIGDLPLGVTMVPVYRQHRVVEDAINTFLGNLALSVVTVMAALMMFMGWRAGTLVGVALLLTVMGTIEIMHLLGIELQRISLGALMIAMGMLVDNGIVIADGMVVGVRRGLTAEEAAIRSVHRTRYPLLGATIIGILAFAPIGLTDDSIGHFLKSLFQVVAISLLLSWLLAVTVVPLLGKYLLKPTAAVPEEQLYSAWYFKPYNFVISFGLRRVWTTTTIIVAITTACLYSMRFVKTSFFPTNNTPIFYVDYYLPEGTDILTTSSDIASLERETGRMDGIRSVTTFVGRGSPRFIAVMEPEQPNPAYARLIVRVNDLDRISDHMQAVNGCWFLFARTPRSGSRGQNFRRDTTRK